MTGATRSLLALLLGLGLGLGLQASHATELIALGRWLKPVGTLWLAGLQMTLVPMIFSLVVTGVADWAGRGGGRTLGFALGLFLALAAAGALGAAGLMTAALNLWPPVAHVGGGATAVAAPAGGIPSLGEQFVALVPTNPVAAMAQMQVAPMVIFALVLGLALARIGGREREAIVTVLNGLARAMLVVVDWVLRAAPVGVFVLALQVALTEGAAAAGVVAQAVLMSSAVVAVALACCYLIAWLGGGVPILAFARAAAGPQAVAAGTTSSMASLPAMVEAAERSLDMPAATAGTVLPLAVSVFRLGNVTLIAGSAVFAAHAAGLQPSLAQILVMGLVIVLTNIGIAGLPAAAVLYAAEAPAFQALGAPLDFLPLLIATAALPDVLDTACNVTADLAAATVVHRFARRRVKTEPAQAGSVA